jgi:membrane protein implicated in regulation of membrane protease activity
MLIFIAIAIGAFGLIAGSFLLGHDNDTDHDAGDAGHEISAEHDATISVFSTKVLATFLMGFGAAGALGIHYGANQLVASLIGAACGLFLAALMYLVLGLFYRQQASSLVATSSAIGGLGTVTVGIDEGQLGEVSLCVNGQYNTYSASSVDGQPIAKGQVVRVRRTLGSQLVVEKEVAAG